ncbi:thiamin-phosphate pyrophosphorylase [Plasmodium gonderi]|uniref:thiamine phosphate synthase n=1 Tax=Plasmodium gonderi TaxID=77519 RepID=A0A1Y1JNA4_PLAGO|nr:thiamin-phosphate pyrophosphorylase [Plasmodium gonderi]GAW81883.1 thiamin-phosphate pyrophosphorylase [Plasmodium gonderi]
MKINSNMNNMHRLRCFCNWSNTHRFRNVDYSLYLVTDDKFLGDKENVCQSFIGKIREGILGGVGLVQLRLKNSDDLYFYNTAVEVKQLLSKYKIPFIINNRLDICLSVDADGVHVGKKDIPINIARNILGEEKIIGATINFSNDEDIQMAINNRVDYIAHEHTLYESSTKPITASYEHGIKKKINMLVNKIKYLQEKGKIDKCVFDCTHPPIILIGGINTNNIKETMENFHDTCAGVAVVSNIIGENCNPFLNSLRLKFIINKYKKCYNDAFINMCTSFLRYIFWNNLESHKKNVYPNFMLEQLEKAQQNDVKYTKFHLYTNMDVKKNVQNFFAKNLDFKIIQLNQLVENNYQEGKLFFLFISKCISIGVEEEDQCQDASKEMFIVCNTHLKKWIDKNKNKNISNALFILIGGELLELFRKKFSPEFFQNNKFFIITKKEEEYNWEPLKCGIEGVSIKYKKNLTNLALKNNHLDNEKIKHFSILLSYFLMVQENITPQFLLKIVREMKVLNAEDENVMKFAASVNISFELLENEHNTEPCFFGEEEQMERLL